MYTFALSRDRCADQTRSTLDDIREAFNATEGQLALYVSLFRLKWAGDWKTMTLELVDVGKGRAEDDEMGRWFAYVDAFVAVSTYVLFIVVLD